MCKPASFVVTKDRVYWSARIDSHEAIISEFKLESLDKDPIRGSALVRVEITPPNENDFEAPLAKWKFHTDQQDTPDWYVAESAERECRAALEMWAKAKLFVTGEHKVETGLSVYFCGNSRATLCGNSRAIFCGNSTADLHDNSIATLRGNSKAILHDNSTAALHDNSTAALHDNSTANLWDNSKAALHDNSTADLHDSSTAALHDNSTAALHDNSTADLCDNSTADLWDNSRADLWDNSRADLHDNSTADLWGNCGGRHDRRQS